jgi:hypothetical protein
LRYLIFAREIWTKKSYQALDMVQDNDNHYHIVLYWISECIVEKLDNFFGQHFVLSAKYYI